MEYARAKRDCSWNVMDSGNGYLAYEYANTELISPIAKMTNPEVVVTIFKA